jgi:hypothetical protein
MTKEDRAARVLNQTGENVELTLKTVVEAYHKKGNQGEETAYFKVIFTDGTILRGFNPGRSVRQNAMFAERWGSFLQALGLSMDDIPYLYNWELFPEGLIEYTKGKRGEKIYAKLTLDENGYLVPGSGRAFSRIPDLTYSDEDLQYITEDTLDKTKARELP